MKTLISGFLGSRALFCDRPALEVGGATLTYDELHSRASSLAATLMEHRDESESALTALFAYRSITAFVGVLGILMSGHGYVPLNRTFPPNRTRFMLQRSASRSLVVDHESEHQLEQVLADVEAGMLIVLPDRQCVTDLEKRWPMHRFIGSSGMLAKKCWRPIDVSPESIAYLLFTSGSTGNPKGVMVTHRNVRSYVEFAVKRYSISCEDRFSQTFDMTFDLSVADMFVAWEAGACVCCPSQKALINPMRFIIDSRLTIWFSVPSTAVFMKRLGALKPGSYPSLRLSLFCGEALPVTVADAWSKAAQNSIVENVYGPTELTIACTFYRWDPITSPAEAKFGVVPIGEPFPGMISLVVDQDLREVNPGDEGELLMTGPQLSKGYWKDPEKTASSFIKLEGRDEIFYRTGDRVCRQIGNGPLLYLGRFDNQVKILGHRVELGEIEAVVRKVFGSDGVVALGWPRTEGGAAGVEVFIEAEKSDLTDVATRVAKLLPIYMTPRRYHFLARFPLNANNKYDRNALLDILKALHEQ